MNDSYKNSKFYEELNFSVIEFVDCNLRNTLYDLCYKDDNFPEMFTEYKNIVHFMLPSQPNQLQILKIENSCFLKTDHSESTNANNEFENINRIKISLANLKGFVCEINTTKCL